MIGKWELQLRRKPEDAMLAIKIRYKMYTTQTYPIICWKIDFQFEFALLTACTAFPRYTKSNVCRSRPGVPHRVRYAITNMYEYIFPTGSIPARHCIYWNCNAKPNKHPSKYFSPGTRRIARGYPWLATAKQRTAKKKVKTMEKMRRSAGRCLQ
jgi:hypothetical protein